MKLRAALLGLVLLVAGCGGGGGGGGGGSSISVSPTSVSFQGTVGDLPPDPVTLQLRYDGDGYVIGFAPGVDVPNWLQIYASDDTPGGATVTFAVSDTAAAGTRTTSVRFATGEVNGDGDVVHVRTVDIPVSYTLTESNLSMSVTPTALAFAADPGGPIPPTQDLSVTFNGASVTVVSQPAWLTLTPVTSIAASPATLRASVNSTDLAENTVLSGQVVLRTSKANSIIERTVTIPVTYTLRPSDLVVFTNPAGLAFDADQNGAPPTGQAMFVAFNGVSSRILAAPPWLSVAPVTAQTTSPSLYGVAPTTTAYPQGTVLTGNIVVGTSHPGSTYTRTTTVPVVYTLTQPFDATSVPLSFEGIRGGTALTTLPVSGYDVQVSGAHAQWSVAATQPWIHPTATGGTGPGTFVVDIDTTGLGVGTFAGEVIVTETASSQVRHLPVTVTLRAADLVVSPQSVVFQVDAATPSSALSRALDITDELNGANAAEAVAWSVASIDQPWLSLTPSSGVSSPTTHPVLALDLTKLKTLASGNYIAIVTITAVNSAGTRTVTLPVTLNLTLPIVDFAMPYIANAGRAGTVVVRGKGFGASEFVVVGTQKLGPFATDGDTQIRVNYPALPVGRYPVYIENAAGLLRSTAEIVSVATPTMAYQFIASSGTRSRLVYDAERARLYGVDRNEQEIERFAFASGTWAAQPAYVLAALTDIALNPDGRALTVTQFDAISSIDLTGPTFLAQQQTGNIDPFCGAFYDHLAMGNAGRAFVTFNYRNCSGFSPTYGYDIRTHQVALYGDYLYAGSVAGSADGSRFYAGTYGVSPDQPVEIYDTLNDALNHSGTISLSLYALSVSGDASRVILNDNNVYNRSLALLGYLGDNLGTSKARVSRDGTRAYVYKVDGGMPRIEIHDLTAGLLPGAVYPTLQTIPLADSPSDCAGSFCVVSLEGTPDDSVLFVSGNRGLAIVPVR